MNVLFDDGLYLDRALVHDHNIRHDRYSEAFQFYKPIDNIWGDFVNRDLEEEYYASHDGCERILHISHDEREARTLRFKEQYFLKQIPFIEHSINPDSINWQDLTIIDIFELFPHYILFRDNVIGIAFTIYKREIFNINGGFCDNRRVAVNNREITSSFYLALRLVTDGREFCDCDEHKTKFLTTDDISFLIQRNINHIDVGSLINEQWNSLTDTYTDLFTPNYDNQNLYRVSPTLVLNKNSHIFSSPNYTGGWDANYNTPSFVAPPRGTRRMVIRIGREHNKYVLFLHGDHETGCPGRIPSD
jgi:hypothetical protein